MIYKAEKPSSRASPDPVGDGIAAGIKRNFQIFSPLDFLAEFTQHIPPTGSHLIRYYGWYSSKTRGLRKKAAAGGERAGASSGDAARCSAPSRSSQTWAMLIKRVYEVDPLACPRCWGRMKVIAFIDPPQGEVIEKILRHCGLWQSRGPTAPPDGKGLVPDPDGCSSHSQPGSLDQPQPADLRGQGEVPGQHLMTTGACRHGDSAYPAGDHALICAANRPSNSRKIVKRPLDSPTPPRKIEFPIRLGGLVMRVLKSRADRPKALTLGAKQPSRRRLAAFERLEDRAAPGGGLAGIMASGGLSWLFGGWPGVSPDRDAYLLASDAGFLFSVEVGQGPNRHFRLTRSGGQQPPNAIVGGSSDEVSYAAATTQSPPPS